ncbi:hypothetical protein DP939_28185 [Spongiactinospora rosea]|uniref:Uncharacterized protein n=1 Tax=Spongiactinospora rosea TaxID=2248750 RepID=A0A366LT54_9ACTN|nr:hypothetical protein [Spongiactinospora rosea]RBQ16937.1 hypothetical protein DP939_28185 [Spongiactinospora rosea]
MNDHRTALISGLRDMADFLHDNPDIPVPRSDVSVLHFPARSEDAEMCAQVDHIAALLDSAIDQEDAAYGHYSTGIRFGPVEYRAVAVLAERRARHEALISYEGCVIPEETS